MTILNKIPSRYWTRVVLLLLAVGVILAFSLVRIERTRAIRGECQAVNKSIATIRSAIVKTAGYQAPTLPNASPDLTAQIASNNKARLGFAEQRANEIPDLLCPGDKRPPKAGADSTTTIPAISVNP